MQSRNELELNRKLLGALEQLNYKDIDKKLYLNGLEIAESLCSQNSSLVNSKDGYGVPILSGLVRSSMATVESVKFLIEKGANLNSTNNHGGTALMTMASVSRKSEIVDLLIANGANVNLESKSGHTALTIAASLNNSSVMDVLIQHIQQQDLGLHLNAAIKAGLLKDHIKNMFEGIGRVYPDYKFPRETLESVIGQCKKEKNVHNYLQEKLADARKSNEVDHARLFASAGGKRGIPKEDVITQPDASKLSQQK